MNQMKRYSRALLFVSALALIPMGAMTLGQEQVKVNTAGVRGGLYIGGGGGYGYRYYPRRAGYYGRYGYRPYLYRQAYRPATYRTYYGSPYYYSYGYPAYRGFYF